MVVAVELWEPRFRISRIAVTEADQSGSASMLVDGTYHPDALLNIESTGRQQRLTALLANNAIRLEQTQ